MDIRESLIPKDWSMGCRTRGIDVTASRTHRIARTDNGYRTSDEAPFGDKEAGFRILEVLDGLAESSPSPPPASLDIYGDMYVSIVSSSRIILTDIRTSYPLLPMV